MTNEGKLYRRRGFAYSPSCPCGRAHPNATAQTAMCVKPPQSFGLAMVLPRQGGLGANPLTVPFHQLRRKREGRGKQMLLFLQEKGNGRGGDVGSVPPTYIPWVLQPRAAPTHEALPDQQQQRNPWKPLTFLVSLWRKLCSDSAGIVFPVS